VYEIPFVCLNSCLPNWFFFFTKSILSNYQIYIHFTNLPNHQIHITKVTLPTCQFHSSMTNTQIHHKLAIGLSCPKCLIFFPYTNSIGISKHCPNFQTLLLPQSYWFPRLKIGHAKLVDLASSNDFALKMCILWTCQCLNMGVDLTNSLSTLQFNLNPNNTKYLCPSIPKLIGPNFLMHHLGLLFWKLTQYATFRD